jgi:methyl-accepting chemotaxis protein
VSLVRNLSLGKKLYGSFALVLVLAGVLGAVAIMSMSSMNTTSTSMSQGALPANTTIDDMTLSADQLVRHQREHLTTTSLSDKAGVAREIRDDATSFHADAKTLAGLITTPAEGAALHRANSLFDKYVHDTSGFVALSDAANIAAGSALLARTDATFSALDNTLTKIAAVEDRRASADSQSIRSSYSSALTLTLALLGALVAMCAAVAVLMTRGITRAVAPILDRLQMLRDNCATDLRSGLSAMANGDLTVPVVPVTPPIDRIGSDELGRIAEAVNEIRARTVASVEAYNETRASLTILVGKVNVASGTLSAASQDMASTSDQAGRAVGEIAQAVTDVAAGAERQVRMVDQARHSSQQTGESAEQANELAQQGVAAADRAATAMVALRNSTGDVTGAIQALSEKSERIGGIVGTITGIAGQTNLLALNAAIEAARAGEQGKGFAVVAEEVRKLAEESQRAAADIASLVEEIQTETEHTVQVVEATAATAEESGTTVETARQVFQQIGAAVEGIRSQIAEIVEATTEVASVAEQSSASTEEVSASTQETSASTQEIAASAHRLAGTAEELHQLVSQFKIAA